MTAPLFSEPTGQIVKVALPVPIGRLFDYEVPAEQGPARPGMRVLVHFSGRLLTGVVVDPTDLPAEAPERSADATRGGRPITPRKIERVLDESPALSRAMVRILGESAHEILCPIGIALTAALPPGEAPKLERTIELTPRGQAARQAGGLAAPLAPAFAWLGEGPQPLAAFRKRFADAAAGLEGLERDGLVRTTTRALGARVRIRRERVAEVAPGVDVDDACATTLKRAAKQAALLRSLERAGEAVAVDSLKALDSGAPARLRQLEARGLVTIFERELRGALVGGGAFSPADEPEHVALTGDQERVLGPITEAIRGETGETLLLQGVTGSGKTEVYLRAVGAALAQGRQALVLVPEITLTHQIVARLRARFGDQLAILHSGLKPSERLEQWARLRAGDTPIAVGARSALFAPLEKLGLIVIDEEHDGAYKNDEGFRYHAVDLAEARARATGCPVVLGSATPALETRYRAEKGEIRRLTLPRRIGGRPLPRVEIVDLAAERAKAPRGRKLILTRPLRTAIEKTLEEGGQTLLFLNRRGFSTRIFCFDCGHAETCSACDVGLVFHAGDHVLRCHYCDFVKPPPETCSGCGAPETALLGIGTERLEEEIRKRFPAARIARLDRDSASRRGHTEAVLAGLRRRDIDILIGTQMIAKGHDFPGVRLVGIVAADLGLHLPDFRAAERCFQLLTQVAGRAGRAAEPGLVLLQTFVPEHYAIAPVVRHDYEGFYREEIAHRSALGYPPFGHLAQAVLSAEDMEAAAAAAGQLAEVARTRLAELAEAGAATALPARRPEVLGPAPAPLARLRGRYRYQILVKSPDEAALRAAFVAMTEAGRKLPAGIQWALDARPRNML